MRLPSFPVIVDQHLDASVFVALNAFGFFQCRYKLKPCWSFCMQERNVEAEVFVLLVPSFFDVHLCLELCQRTPCFWINHSVRDFFHLILNFFLQLVFHRVGQTLDLTETGFEELKDARYLCHDALDDRIHHKLALIEERLVFEIFQ